MWEADDIFLLSVVTFDFLTKESQVRSVFPLIVISPQFFGKSVGYTIHNYGKRGPAIHIVIKRKVHNYFYIFCFNFEKKLRVHGRMTL